MTTLREFLQTRPDLVEGLRPYVAVPDWLGAESWLNAQIAPQPVTRMKTVSRKITALGVMSALGAERGAAVLDALQAIADGGNSAVKWALKFLQSDSGIDLGDDETRRTLDALATAGAIPADDAADLKALAEASIAEPGAAAFAGWPIIEYDIRVAWFNDNGSEFFPA